MKFVWMFCVLQLCGGLRYFVVSCIHYLSVKKLSKKLVNYTKKCLALTLQKVEFVMCYSFTDEKTGSVRNEKSGSYNYISIIIPNTGQDSHTRQSYKTVIPLHVLPLALSWNPALHLQ